MKVISQLIAILGIGLTTAMTGVTYSTEAHACNEEIVLLSAGESAGEENVAGETLEDVTTRKSKPKRLETESNEKIIIPAGQKDLVRAQERGKGLNFVEVEGVEVVEILPDDNKGRRHQKFVVRLANGRTVTAVYNVSFSHRLPIKAGSVISLAGQYIWDREGGILHWLHEDPSNRRPDGYVEINGEYYGDER